MVSSPIKNIFMVIDNIKLKNCTYRLSCLHLKVKRLINIGSFLIEVSISRYLPQSLISKIKASYNYLLHLQFLG